MNKNVAAIMRHKAVGIITVSPDTPVITALKMMAERNIGSVVVMDDDQYLGIMTERDYSRKVVLKGRSSVETTAVQIMTADLPTIKPSDSIEHCMQLMSDRNIRYLPVFENDSIAGIISMTDVIKEIISSQEETITHLRDYVHSSL
ncbi:CBS domain-containing protein [Ferruginibacter albus]|uniref:CBS domain-containing protein n=1 Tax=Ferruginibacter albus TaxID=2875540 RepID=UPI001CC57043|nr:CBS domain-containing protein [Ferruginibacter albus]UAY50633.1 CBS domain-containing protein [Ferruginibacter albus]